MLNILQLMVWTLPVLLPLQAQIYRQSIKFNFHCNIGSRYLRFIHQCKVGYRHWWLTLMHIGIGISQVQITVNTGIHWNSLMHLAYVIRLTNKYVKHSIFQSVCCSVVSKVNYSLLTLSVYRCFFQVFVCL